MPTSNRAVIYSEPGTLKTEVIELPIPQPGRGEILVRLLYSGVCHTDVGFCMNHFPNLPVPTQAGQIGGHEGLDLAAAAPLMCGGISVYTSLRTAGMRIGDWVVISGAGGGLGHLGIQYAKALGGKVLAVDIGAKEELCRSLGANEFVDFTKFSADEHLAAKIKDITDGGARIALMCASSSKAYSQAMSWLGFRGVMACLGIPEKEGTLVPSITSMVGNELRIIATKTGNRMDAKQCLELAVQGGVTPQYELRKMEDLSSIFEDLENEARVGFPAKTREMAAGDRVAVTGKGIYSSIIVYRGAFHRLNRFPGPFAARISNLYVTLLSIKKFQLYEEVQQLHEKYGDIVRIALRDYEPRVAKYTNRLLERIEEMQGLPFDASTWFNFYSFDVMGDLAFGKGFDMLKNGVMHYFMKSVHTNMLLVSAFSHLVWIFPLFKEIPGLNYEHIKFQKWLSAQVVERQKTKSDTPDLFSWILSDYDAIDKPSKQDTVDLHGDAHLIVVAGSDTTAASLTCLFFELATNPEACRRLQDEIDQYYAGINEVDHLTLSKLKYLQACIDESLRLHPPVPSGLQRMTPPEGLQIGDAFIPGNTILQIPAHTLYRDKRVFERPTEFIPERWTTQPELTKNGSIFHPFSMGRYSCAGKQLGLMELRYVTSQVLRRYDVKLAEGRTPEGFLAGPAPPAERLLDDSRRLKKRELDRKAQRLARERTKSRIAELEAMVEHLRQSDANTQILSLMDQLSQVTKERDKTRQVLRSLDNTIHRHLAETTTSTSQPSTHPGNDALVLPLQIPRPLEPNSEQRCDASSMCIPPGSTGPGVWDDPLECLSGIQANASVGCGFDNQPNHQGSLDGLNLLNLPPGSASDGEISYGDDVIVPKAIICHCTSSQASRRGIQDPPPNKWRAANELLGRSTCLSRAEIAAEDRTSEDTPVRAVLEGWDSVEQDGKMTDSWRKLRGVDEVCFKTCSQIERLAILRMMHVLMTYHGDPTMERHASVPHWFLMRPSQTIAHSYAIDYFVWILWPYDFRDTYMHNSETGRFHLSPLFEERIRDISAWTMSPDFFLQFPELYGDIPSYLSVPASVSNVASGLVPYAHGAQRLVERRGKNAKTPSQGIATEAMEN
ncbi:hypothetical protein G7Z17_g333 [Cylindrodendrum hubeiense]|uniref:Alcohol dehydrogenase-like C-terminal domain-containing protein n=1 Tax=Cylindrodendrum hubeiense TaxID=595255 RepID=A0A9P5HHA1_9HYPO|nr:hypothetical protein G7Z17_g333 [Cylindrodendrum hubeiense]